MTDGIAEILGEAPSLAVLPESYCQLTAVLDDPTANVTRIAAAVRVDPALAAGVLRLANSASVSPRDPVETVTRAVMVLGTSQIRQMALSLTVIRMFRGMPEHLLDMQSFWKHSAAVAMLCHLLATARGQAHTEAVYVAGLLHDIGTLLLCVTRPREARRIMMITENGSRPLPEVERTVLGFSHAELGGALLEQWGLSEGQVEAVRWHHAPSEAAPDHQPMADLVHVADVSVSALRIGNAGERAAHALDVHAWTRLSVGPEALERGLDALDGQLTDLVLALGRASTGTPQG